MKVQSEEESQIVVEQDIASPAAVEELIVEDENEILEFIYSDEEEMEAHIKEETQPLKRKTSKKNIRRRQLKRK